MGGVGHLAGTIVWCDLDPAVGHEQAGRRPALVISSSDFSEAIASMAIIVPCTTRNRGWLSHVPVSGPTGLSRPTYAVTEQPRTISTERIHRVLGRADNATMTSVTAWVRTWVEAAV